MIDLSEVEKLLNTRTADKDNLISEITSNILKPKGKRIRSNFLLLLYYTLQSSSFSQSTEVYKAAAAIELIHNATLLHDDVIDNNDYRRGLKASHIVWGNKRAILGGDALLSIAFQLVAECNNTKVVEAFASAAYKITYSELRQLEENANLELSYDDYIQIIIDKTSALFELAAETVAILLQKNPKETKAIGTNLGVAFQMVDDILDYSSSISELGKVVGNDFVDKKVTLPVILSYKISPEFWQENFGQIEKLPLAISLLEEQKVFEQSYKVAAMYSERAKQEIESLPDSSYKAELFEWIDLMMKRKK